MNEAYELKRHRLTRYYWLFKAKEDLIFRLIEKTSKNTAILEVGCGSGNIIKFLMARGYAKISGIDISRQAITGCQKLGIKNVFLRDGKKTGFAASSFDIIIASDVLEHIDNEEAAIYEWSRILKKEGKLILSVPAFRFLWSRHDRVCNHYRRYSKKEITNFFKRNNFKIEKISYWNFSSFFPVCLLRLCQRIFPKRFSQSDQLYELPPYLNMFLTFLLKLENKLFLRWGFPFGVTIFTVAIKK